MISKKRKINFIIFVAAFFVLAPLVVLYSTGHIFSEGFGLLKTGGMYLMSAPNNSQIYLNSKLIDTTSFFNRSILIRDLRPNVYDVVVKKEGYNVWKKKIKVSDNLVSDARVFMLQEKVETREILKYLSKETASSTGTSTISKILNTEYSDLVANFSAKKATTTVKDKNLGTVAYPIMNKKIGLWKEGGKVFMSWSGSVDSAPNTFCDERECNKKVMLFDLGREPRKIDFLPGENDIVVLSFEDSIFAVEAEVNPDKSIQLLYKGKTPDFRIIDGIIFVKDGEYLAEILL
jgi:hypothetical protein